MSATRRDFLKATTAGVAVLRMDQIVGSALLRRFLEGADDRTTSGQRADVIIIGATPAGIAAAVAAARMGATIILIEETRHVGGIISGGLTNADVGKPGADGGSFDEYRSRLRQHYATKYGQNSQQFRDCREGKCVEPHVAEKIFNDMVAEQPRIKLITEHYLCRVESHGYEIEAVVVRHVDGKSPALAIFGRVFIDATYEGDLAAAAGVAYRVGRENRAEYDERLAGKIYTRLSTGEILPGSTGEGDAGIEAFCFRIFITSDPTNRVPFAKPEKYRREDYRHLLADIKAGKITQIRQTMQFRTMPNGKIELNSEDPARGGVPSESLDLAEENWGWPEANREARKRLFSRYWSYQEGLLWFLQTDQEVPGAMRREMANYGFCRDEFVDNNQRPHHIYVREGRRIEGEYKFTQREEDPDPNTGTPRVHIDSIAVASWAWDSHGVHKYNPAFPGTREGYFLVEHPPLQVPYGVMVPKKVDRLLVPVACSASHVGYQAIRMEPVFMALGQAAGIAAAQAVSADIEVRHVSVAQVQVNLTRQNGVISYFEDVPLDHPAFTAIQFLGPRGLGRDFKATPDQILNQDEAAELFARILEACGKPWQGPAVTDVPVTGAMLAKWLRAADLKLPCGMQETVVMKKELTVGDFAVVVAGALTDNLGTNVPPGASEHFLLR
jgi:hypothetical protein